MGPRLGPRLTAEDNRRRQTSRGPGPGAVEARHVDSAAGRDVKAHKGPQGRGRKGSRPRTRGGLRTGRRKPGCWAGPEGRRVSDERRGRERLRRNGGVEWRAPRRLPRTPERLDSALRAPFPPLAKGAAAPPSASEHARVSITLL